MRKLSLCIIIIFVFVEAFAQSPHGKSIGKKDCSLCHVSTSWKVDKSKMKFSHAETNFKLTGQHNQVDCSLCHASLDYSHAQTYCISCHKDIHQNTVGADCQNCHTTNAWVVINIQQVHLLGRFPLVGVHRTVDCTRCHPGYNNLNYQPLGVTCYSCHVLDYNNAKAPDHIAAHYSTDCESCHNITSIVWNTPNFQHDFFPLKGGHNINNCFACHKPNVFTGLSTSCVSCHLNSYNATTNPNHLVLKLSTDCRLCHTITSFTQTTFNHASTGFVLTGAHMLVQCSSCHTSGFQGTPTTCISCHQQAYNSATTPNHSAAGIPTDCSQCHNSIAWIPSTFDHSNTGFTLTGSHVTLQCSSCHIGKVTGDSPFCYSCHQANYVSAANHVAQSYPTNCEMCHNTIDWSQSTFNHQTTAFPLTGAHTTVLCSNCHTSGFGTIPTTCVSCHQANYNSTNNPNHSSLQISTSCETCHSTNIGWTPASFSMHNNFFVLTGFHITLSCESCHNGVYNGTAPGSTCISCHQTDYNNTTNPNHAVAQFPVDCSTCHSQTAWSPSTFNHDQQYFAIYSGTHLNRWTLCSQCHQNPANFSQFTCMSSGCHPQTQTDNEHSGIAGYSYLASACYSCHPRGSSNKIHRFIKPLGILK